MTDTLTDEQMARIAEAHGWERIGSCWVDDQWMATGGRLSDAGAWRVMVSGKMDAEWRGAYQTRLRVGLSTDGGALWTVLALHLDPNHAIALAELARLDSHPVSLDRAR